MEEINQISEDIINNIEEVIVGKREVIEKVLVCFLSGGHLLLEDVPGVGKTILARSLAVSSGVDFSRVQCTPDLLPKDITGVNIYRQDKQGFEFSAGPIFSQVLLVDEINRTTPRTQSGLLEAMAEGQVSVEGMSKELPEPFFVISTQNPVEFDGTFPLPEAQLDRFMMQTEIGYPNQAEEANILELVKKKHPINSLESVVDAEKINQIKTKIRDVHVEDKVRNYIVEIVSRTRNNSDLLLGVSPRGSIDLYHAAQALAAIRGRDYVIPDDIKELAVDVLSHRIVVSSEISLKGKDKRTIIEQILNNVAVPINGEG